MWLTFLFACAACIIIFYIPGMLFFRGILFSWATSLFIAPVASVLMIVIFGAIAEPIGIECNIATVGFFAVTFIATVWIIRLTVVNVFGLSKERHGVFGAGGNAVKMVVAVIIVSCVVAATFYVKGLVGPDSITQSYDNVFHYNVTESFVRSGKWSIFSVGYYLDVPAGQAPFTGTGFYPAGWHCVVATVAELTMSDVPLAANAVNTMLIAVVFPLSMSYLFLVVFREGVVSISAAPLMLSSSLFPWLLLGVWPLFPNAISMSMLPIVIGAFLRLTALGKLGVGHRFVHIIAVVVGIMGLAVLQPNSVFALAVILAPYLVSLCGEYTLVKGGGRTRAFLGCMLVVAAVSALWIILSQASAFQGVVGYYWPPVASVSEAFLQFVAGSPFGLAPNYPLAILVVVGIIHICVCDRSKLWLVFAYVLAGILFVVAAGVGDTPAKHILTGFWYTDPYRVSAISAIPCILLAGDAVFFIVETVSSNFSVECARETVDFVAMALLCVLLYVQPGAPAHGLVQSVAGFNAYSIYSEDERCFVKQAAEIIPDNSVVLNVPFDGSVFALSEDGLNVFYRSKGDFNTQFETEDSKLIRENADTAYKNQKVADAMERCSISYVLLFDSGLDDISPTFNNYDSRDWGGIQRINDASPGYQLVLAKDNMRLYKVVLDS